MDGVLKLFLSFTSLNLVNKLIPLITIPILTSKLGIENFGVYSLIFTMLAFIETFVDFGFRKTAVNQLLSCNSKLEENTLLNSIISTKLFLGTIIFFFVFLAVIITNLLSLELLIYLTPMVLGYVLNQEWYFHGKNKMDSYLYLSLIMKLIYVLALIFLIKKSDDLNIAIALNSIIYFLISVLSLTQIYYSNNFYLQLLFQSVFLKLSQNLYFFLASLSTYFYTKFNFVLAGIFYDIKIIGTFAIMDKVVNFIKQLSVVFTNSVYPYLSSIFLLDLRKFKNKIKLFSFFLFFLFSILSIIFYYNSELLFKFLNKDLLSYKSSNDILFLLLLGVPLHVTNSLLGLALLISDKQKDLFKITLFTSLLNVLLLILVGNNYSINTFIVANVFIQIVLNISCFKKINRLSID